MLLFFQYSSVLNKLFIDMGKYVQVSFSAGKNPPAGLYIRALPVYSDAAYCKDPVKRCPNHASPSDASNKGFPQVGLPVVMRTKDLTITS